MSNRKRGILLTFFIHLIFFCSLNAQDKDEAQEKLFDSLYFVVNTNSTDIYNHGKYLLKISKNDLQRARSYNIIGDGLYKQGRYLEAVVQLEKGNEYAIKAKSDYWRLYLTNLLIRTYKYAGLTAKAEEYIEVMKGLNVKEELDKTLALQQVKALMFEIDKNYCEAAKYRGETTDKITKRLSHEPLDHAKNYIVPSKILYMYDLIKCGNIGATRKELADIEKIMEITGLKDNFNMKSYYFLTKAHLNIHDKGDEKITKEYLQIAYEDVLKSNTNSWIKTVVDDILSTKIFSDAESKKFYAKLVELSEESLSQHGKLTDKILNEKDNQITAKENKENKFAIIIGCIILVLIISLLITTRNNKKNQAAFDKILSEIQNKPSEITIENVSTEGENKDHLESKDRIISEDVENELLKNLKIFESKHQFLQKDMSSSNMATKLKTTPRNLAYILKKHRSNDFNNYINEVRIDYIIKELIENKKLRNYKISVLAELCGYKSHSQFTMVFKNKKGLSPSQFIEKINKTDN